jgi:hypothetical protein
LSFPEAQCSGPPPPRLLDGLKSFAQYQLYCVRVIQGESEVGLLLLNEAPILLPELILSSNAF